MTKRVKYTKELLEELVKKSKSVAQVIRAMGLREAGGTYSHIQRKIKEYGIDKSHFLGFGWSKGRKSLKKLTHGQILVKRDRGRRQSAYRLRRALIESGREYICEKCGQKPEWDGQELRLQVDHKSRDWLDDREENLRFLCPNCHTQTDGYNGSKGFTELITTKRPNKKQKYFHGEWRNRLKPKQQKVQRPEYEVLTEDVKELGYCGTGRKYGVTDNTIRKWIKMHEKYSNVA